jgi:hypothetical protein
MAGAVFGRKFHAPPDTAPSGLEPDAGDVTLRAVGSTCLDALFGDGELSAVGPPGGELVPVRGVGLTAFVVVVVVVVRDT